MWTEDLRTLGYLDEGGSAERALARFQRHAKRTYRKSSTGEVSVETPVYLGPEDGVAHPMTLDEIARWVAKAYRAPVGYFGVAKVNTWGALRGDVAEAWLGLMARVLELGGTIDGPYGDTRRPLMKTISVGASKYSFHICGRAIDLNQGQSRYFVVQEPLGTRIFWRLYCKTADQTGAQGQKIEAGTVRYHSFWAHAELPMPAGYYLDLTREIESGGWFERIRAQAGWQQETRKSEWWHFQWVPDKQKTFQDECELMGIAEPQLRAMGYLDADLDHAPG